MTTTHAGTPNGFCWVDLKTHDPQGTADFFASTLGWRFAVDEDDWRKATKFSVDGHQIGGVSDLSNPVYPPGTPPHLAYYLSVDDVDRRVEGATAAGAEVVVEAFDVADQGRRATLVDPYGAAVSLWQAREFGGWTHDGGLPGTPHRMVLACAEPDPAARFYADTLGADLTRVGFAASTASGVEGYAPAWELVVGVADLESVGVRAAEFAPPDGLVRSEAAQPGTVRLTSPEGLGVWLTRTHARDGG